MSSIKVVVLSMVVICSTILSGCNKDQATTEQIPFVMVTQPHTGYDDLKSYAGDVQARQQTILSFRVAGQVIKRSVDVGDRVKAGQILAELDVKDAELQRNSAQAQLDNARSAAQIAEQELKRYKELLPIHAVSRSQFDAIENQHKAAISALKQAEANFKVSNNQTEYNQLKANNHGVITQRDIEVGQVVAAGQSAFQLAIDGEREVVIGVPEQAISQIKVGQPAWVVLWSNPKDRIAAVIREISPAADQTRTFRVKVALKQGQSNIQLGQSARVFFSQQQDDVLSIPLSSVSAVQNQAYVWVVQPDQTLKKVQVSLGAYGRDTVPVLSGLAPSDYVVIGGVHLLRDKQKIRPIDRENRTVTVRAGG